MKRTSRGRDFGQATSRPSSRFSQSSNDPSTTPKPTPKHQKFDSSSRAQCKLNLTTNSYDIRTSSNDGLVYEYQLSVVTSEGCKNIPPKVLTRNFVSKSIRKLVMDELIPKLVATSNHKNSVVIESNLEAVYSSNPFNLQEQETKVGQSSSTLKHSSSEFEFNKLSLKTDLLTCLQVDIAIKFTRSISLSKLGQNPQLLKSIIHHQMMLTMIRYGSVYYESHNDRLDSQADSNRLDLISQHIMGISVSGLKVTADNQKLIVINCPHSYITQTYRLIDLLASFIAGRPLILSGNISSCNIHIMQKIESIVGNEDLFLDFCAILNGFKCEPIGSNGCVKLRFKLSEESASSLKMDDNRTVQEYYHDKGTTLTYPNLPCIVSSSHIYPFEVCSLLADQKVPMFRLSSRARFHLSNINKAKPHVSKMMSAQARDKIERINKNIFFNFGVQLSQTPVKAHGSSLLAPTLQFQDLQLVPQRDFWESGKFYHPVQPMENWSLVNTVDVDPRREERFFYEFAEYCKRFGFYLGKPSIIFKPKQAIIDQPDSINNIIDDCQKLSRERLKFIMFIIDSSSTALNRLIHLCFDEHPNLTATCLRVDSINNERQQRAIFRTLVHKLNARLGGTNVMYNQRTLASLNVDCGDLMVIGLDVTHPDNELNGVSIVGCAYTYSNDLFRHRSLVWPQAARTEIIGRMDSLVGQLLHEYYEENKGRLPRHIIVYRDGVSHEEFEKVKAVEVAKALATIEEIASETGHSKPNLSFVIAQKRHTMRFYHEHSSHISNPPSGTLIDRDVVTQIGREFYLYSNTSPQATARPLHYHVLLDSLGIESLQRLTYILCFNFGKCSGTLSMPSSLKYAHNAAYDARNRVINAKEFNENKFYRNKFFC